tara:strand:- start:4633 stop:6468 length:1836 start_codon:yes stop_codon:yes gene_type:complete
MGIITSMRTQMKPIMWAILILFSVGMFFWDIDPSIFFGGNSSNRGNNVGSLNGKPILYDDFNRFVSDEISRIEKQSSESMNDADREYVRAVVWERLIQDLLIQDQIEQNKISVSDDEVVYQLQNNPPDFLQSSPVFITDGQFDLERYMEAVTNNPEKLDWRPIENFMQNIYLPNYKLQQLIINAASVSNQDILDSYKQRFINYNIEVLHITDKAIPEDFSLEASEQELMKLYNENIENYEEPEMRYMKYVKWPIVSDYNDSLRVELEITNLINRINEGESFSDLANYYTEDPGNSLNPDSLNDGKLGWFNKGQMVKEFEEAAFSGNKGEVIGPILTQFGYHIIKINDKRNTDEGEEQVNASHILLRISPGNDTENKLRTLSSIFSLESKEYGFFDLADSLGMEIHSASAVQKKSIFIDDIGVARDAVKFAFNSEVGEVSDYIENNDYFMVFYLEKVSDEKVISFENVKETLTEESTRNIKEREIKRIADSIVVNENLDLLKLSEKNPNFEYVKETSGNLIGSFESIGKSNYVAGALINSKKGDLLGPLPTIRGQAFVKILDIDKLDQKDFDEKKESLKFSLIIQRQNLIWSNWLQGLRDDAKIEDNRFDFY